MSLNAILWYGLSAGICSSLLFFLMGRALIGRVVRELPDQLHSFLENDSVQQSITDKFDEFVRVRLSEALPVLRMFIDDQLIAELKPVFMAEVSHGIPDLAGDAKLIRALRHTLFVRLQKASIRLVMILVAGHLICAGAVSLIN